MSTTTTVTHPDGTVVTCTTTTVASPEKLVLKYWNGRGLMEVARQLLSALQEVKKHSRYDLVQALEALERAAAARGGEGRPAGAQAQAPQPASGADSTGKGGRTRARAA